MLTSSNLEQRFPKDLEKLMRRGTNSSGITIMTTSTELSPGSSSGTTASDDDDSSPHPIAPNDVSDGSSDCSDCSGSDYSSEDEDDDDSCSEGSQSETYGSEMHDTFPVDDGNISSNLGGAGVSVATAEAFVPPPSTAANVVAECTDEPEDMDETDDDEEDGSEDDDDDDDSDDDDSSDEDYSESMVSSSGDGSSDSEDYDDLMATLPIALGRKGGAPATLPFPPPPPPPPPLASTVPEVPAMGLPIGLGSSGPSDAAAGEGVNPLEGLALLQNIRSELEQVGRLIVAKKTGEKFLQRAHILASINWLATNVPACVLDHLGQEIRRNLNKDKTAEVATTTPEDVHFIEDSSSEASELSDLDFSDMDFDYDGDFMGFSSPRAAPRFRPGSDADPLSSSAHNPAKRSAPKRTMSRSTSESRLAVNKLYKTKPSLSRNSSTVSYASTLVSTRQQGLSRMARRLSVGTSFQTFTEKKRDGNLPAVSYFQCALLFVDISGFTELATLLDPENLSKVINSYFQAIVQKVSEFQGDIQKFAGDALFAEWRVSQNTSLAQCVEAAAACASSLARDCGNFPVMAFGGSVGGGAPLTYLDVHCGLGVGEMAGVHIGDNKLRREYVYIGNPIAQATKACTAAQKGQVVASRKVFNVLSWSGVIEEPFALQGKEFFVITDRGETKLDEKKLSVYNKGIRNAKSRGITDHVDGLEVDALIEYRRLMSLYVHPVVVSNDVAASDDFKSSRANSVAQERHREDAELRSVFVMFINPQIAVDLSGDDYLESAHRLNDILTLTTRELNRYNGHMRQLIVDDKGLVIIATFGLRGSSFPNMVAERALPATMVIHNALQIELGVDSRIGATFGDVYCGPVGGVHRNEYAVMGPSVNLAARLMGSKDNPGILVDHAVRRLASRTYSFNALTPVAAKGYKELVQIFEPLTELERSWGKIEANFVGRESEIKRIISLSKEMSSVVVSDPRLVLISSSSGMGKSTLLAHSIEHVRKMLGPLSSRLLITRDVGKESDASVPFKTIRPILLKVLQSYADRSREGYADSKSIVSGAFSAWGNGSAFDLTSVATQESSKVVSSSEAGDMLKALSASLADSRAAVLAESVRRLVIQGPSNDEELHGWNVSAPVLKEMAGFITQIFKLCTEDMKLTLIALDNLHHADPASWLVLRQIFETASNVLMIGTSFGAADSTFRVEHDFWQSLNDTFANNGRFVKMEIGVLSASELEIMTMKALGVSREMVDKETLKEVVVQSGGMPHFAAKILQGIKERTASGTVEAFGEHDESISEIILHRVDTFDLNLRNTLNVGAVVGELFTFKDVLAVLIESSDSKEADLRQQILDSLSLAMKEGILCVGGKANAFTDEESAIEDETVLSFRHSIWRTTLLGLMLDSRKRDVHRKIGTAMDKIMSSDSVSLGFRRKLFNHWKLAGDTSRAAAVGVALVRDLQGDPSSRPDSIDLLKEGLSMWGWNTLADGNIGGFSEQVLSHTTAKDQSDILRLMVALGKEYTACDRRGESVKTFEDALRIQSVAERSSKLQDRSIVFPAYVGLATALADGVVHQDVHCQYQQTLLRKYIEETRKHGRLIHHIYALYLQMQFYAAQDELDKAVAVQSLIRKIYKPDRHCGGLRNVYGCDAGALSFSLAAFYDLCKGNTRQALRSCRQVLKELLPKVKSDYHQAFGTMYPLVIVLKEAGFSAEARAFFEKAVIAPFGDHHNIFESLNILFTLTGKGKVSEDKINEFADWATKRENVVHGERVSMVTGRLGRCANSLSAEICWLLATLTKAGVRRTTLIEYSKQLANHASLFNRKHGFTLARKHSQAILSKLRMLSELDHDDDGDD